MPHVTQSFRWFEDNAARLREKAGPFKNMLYIGVRHDMRPWWHDVLVPGLGVKNVTVLEIHQPNVDKFKEETKAGRWPQVKRVVRGDARDARSIFMNGHFDVVFWDHGPEHVSEDDLKACTPHLKAISTLLIYCGPWGTWAQGPEGGNEHEEHRCILHPHLMSELGMSETVTLNGYGQDNKGEIISVWVDNG